MVTGVRFRYARGSQVTGAGCRPERAGEWGAEKVGAIAEAVLRGAFPRNGRYFDRLLDAIVDNAWREAVPERRPVPRTMVQ